MKIEDTVAVITGAASAVGRAVGLELARRNVHGLALVDHRTSVGRVTRIINEAAGDWIGLNFHGDVMDAGFRKAVFEETGERCGKINVCVPISVTPRLPIRAHGLEAELICPVLWAHQMVAGIAEKRGQQNCQGWQASEPLQGMVVFITPAMILSHSAHRIDAAAKSKVNSATVSLMADADFHGVGCAAVVSNSRRTQDLENAGILFEKIFPSIHVQQQTSPEAIAEAICFIIANASFRETTSGKVG